MIVLILIFLGLCFGSFVNAVVWRLHEQSKNKGKQSKVNLSILKGRSICPNCKHGLAAKDLIPLLSWLSLGGKCRYCHKPISWQYPLVEALTAGLFVLSYAFWPFALHTPFSVLLIAFWLAFLVGLVALAVYDLRWYLLPDKIVFPLMYLGLIQAVALLIHGPFWHQFWAIGVSFLIGGGLFYLLFQISDGRWIGGGDVKLGALLGLILADGGLMVFTIFTASLLGTLISLPLLLAHKVNKKSRIPFGPLLIIAAIIARLFGGAFIHWYSKQLSTGL